MDQPKWKRFESLAYEIQKELTGDAEVKLGDVIKGVDSKTDRQIDISIRRQVGPHPILIVIDCKDYSEPLDVKDIETFAGLVKDVRASRGALIVSSGFSEAALTLARNHGIDTFRLVDTGSIDWRTYATIPCLLQRTYLHGFSFRFGSVPMERFEIPIRPEELMALEFYSPDGTERGILGEMVQGKWDRAEMSREPGTHEVSLGDHLVTRFRGIESHQGVVALVIVKRTFYLGALPVRLRGLQNVQTGGVITRSVTTDFIDFHKIESSQDKAWTEISDPSALAVVKPAITLAYFDVHLAGSASKPAPKT